MKKVIGRIRTAPLLAVLIALAAGGAWAAITATEVWEAAEIKANYDSETGLISGHNNSGYKLNVGTGLVVDDSAGAYTLGSDGSITINSAASHGVTIDLAGKANGSNPTSLSILVKYRSLSACNQASLISAFMTREGSKPECGLIQTTNNALTLKPYWYIASNSSCYNFDISSPSVSASGGYTLFSYDRSTIKGYTGSELTELSGGTASMAWTGPTFKTAAIGGSSGEVSDFNNKWPGMVIEKIALFVGNAYTSDAIATYYFPSDDPTALDYDFVKTISSNTALSEITSWDTGTGTPGAEDTVHIVCENSAVLTIDTAINADTLWVEGGSVTLANGASITANMVLGSPITVAASAIASISGASVYNSIACGSYSTLNISNCAINGAITDGDDLRNTHATLNITDCAINGGITAGQNNYATINTAGAVVFRSFADNYFKYSSTLNVKSGGTTTYNSKSDKKLWCTVRVEKNATLINERQNSFDYDSNASYPIHAYIYGTLTLNQKWMVGKCARYIHLYDGALINGSAENALHSNIAEHACDFIAEEGTSTITAPFVKGAGTINVVTRENAMLVLSTSQALAKSGAGTLRIKNTHLVSDISGSEGVLELYNDSGENKTHYNTISFAGTIKATRENSSKSHNVFGNGTEVTATTGQDLVLTGMPKLEVAGSYAYLCLNAQLANQNLSVKNLTYEGDSSDAKVDPVYNDGTSSGNMSQIKTIKTKQTEDTICNLIFNGESNGGKRQSGLYVYGDMDAVHSLTLTKESTTFGPLTVENYGKVIFSGSGKWANGTVTVGVNGVLEAQHTAALGVVTLQDGATIVVPTVSSAVVPLTGTTVTLPTSGTVNVDLTGVSVAEGESVTVISATSLVNANASIFHQTEGGWRFSVDNNTIKATKLGTVAWSDGTWSDGDLTGYASASITASGTQDVTLPTSATFDTLTITGSGSITLKSTSSETCTVAALSIDAGVTLNASNNLVVTGAISGAGALVLDVASEETMTLPATTASQLTKRGNGELILGGNTSISGDVSVEAGKLTNSSAATSEFGGIFTVESNASVDVYGKLELSKAPNSYGTDAIAAFIIQENANVTANGTIYVKSVNNRVLIRGCLNISGVFLCQGDAKVFSCGYVTITGSGKFWVNYGVVENSGAIALTGLPCLSYGSNDPTKITNSSTGVITFNLIANGDVRSTDLTKYIEGSGKVVLNGDSYWFGFSRTGQWSSDIAIENNLGTTKTTGGLVFSRTSAIGTLSGTGQIRADLDTGNTDPSDRVITVVQAANSEWSGILSNAAKMGSVVVTAKKGATAKTLTLSGTQTVGKPLTVTTATDTYDSGSVNLTGTWASDVTVNGEFGGTGTVSGGLTLNAGSTFKVWTTAANGLAVSGALTLPATGSVTVDVTAIADAIAASGATGVPLITVTSGIDASTDISALTEPEGYYLAPGANEIRIYPVGAILHVGETETKFASVDAAVTQLQSESNKDAYVEIVSGTCTLDPETLASAGLIYDSSEQTYHYAAAQIGSTNYGTLSAAVSAAATSGDTITLLRDTAEQNVDVSDKEITLVEGEYTFSGTFTGDGTIVMTTVPKAISTSMWAAGWEGVLWLKNCTFTKAAYDPVVFGNSTSTLRLTGCSGSLNKAFDSAGRISLTTLDLQDEGNTVAFSITDGFPVYGFTSFAKLTGTGTLAGNDSSSSQCYHFADASDFRGSITIGSSSYLRVKLGGDTSDTKSSNYKKIWVEAGSSVSVAAGKTWTAPNGFVIDGTVSVATTGALSNNSISGAGAIAYAAVPSTEPTFDSSWTGKVELAGFTAAGQKLQKFGVDGSTIVLKGDVAGWLGENGSQQVPVAAKLQLDANLTISALSTGWRYTFAELTGSGNFSITATGSATGLTITKVVSTYSGTISNSSSTTLNIGTLELTSTPTTGTKILSTGGTGTISVGAVTVNGEAADFRWESRSDGVYVRASAVASYGGTAYDTIAEAIAAAVQAGDTYANVTILDQNATCPDGYYVDTENGNALAKYAAAAVTVGETTTTQWFTTFQAAIDAAVADKQKTTYAVAYADGTATASGTGANVFMLMPNGYDVTVMCSVAGYGAYAQGQEIQGFAGVYQYSAVAAAATFTWTGAAGDNLWATAGNWSSADGTVAVAPANSLYTAVRHNSSQWQCGNRNGERGRGSGTAQH